MVLPVPDPEPPDVATDSTLQLAAVFTAELRVHNGVLAAMVPDYVRAAGYEGPEAQRSDRTLWMDVAARLGEDTGSITSFFSHRDELVLAVRLRCLGELHWTLTWQELDDPWIDDAGRSLLAGGPSATSAVLAPDGTVVAARDDYAAVLGMPAVLGSSWADCVPTDLGDLAAELIAAGQGDRVVGSAVGGPRWLRMQLDPAVQAGTGRALFVVRVEVAAAGGRSALAELVTDPLTGLYNRRAFFDLARLDDATTSTFVGVGFAGIRRFKRINELWGQAVGDQCLVETADWLRSLAGPGDVVVRLSSAKFIVLCADGSPVAALLEHNSERRVHVGGDQILLSLQAGWAPRRAGASLRDTAEEAELALAVARRDTWRTVVNWTSDISRETAAAAAAEEAVQQAVADGQEAVFFQPVVDVARRRVDGVEALVRLGGPAANLPTELILSASHKLGLTPHFAQRVFELAFAQGRELRQAFPDCLIGVNVSREFLGTRLAIDTVLAAAAANDLPLDQVIVELTEDVAAGLSTELLVSEVHRAADLGLRVVIDDFGRGETSLALLRRLPLSGIKLDRSLLPLDDDARAWDFVEGTVTLLSRLTDRLIAEGIETELQSRRLLELGVTLQQGYLFGAPRPSEHWLRNPVVLPGFTP